MRSTFKKAIYIIRGDFNLTDIDWKNHNVTDSHYPHRVSKTFLDITMDLSLEQVVNFPTRVQNTLDLMFMSHPSLKFRCKPLPQIGLKRDHYIVLIDTSIQPTRTMLPRRKILISKKANTKGIKQRLQNFSDQFCTDSTHSIEDMWSSFKSAISSAPNCIKQVWWLPELNRHLTGIFWPTRFDVTIETIVSIVTSNLIGQN